MGVVVTCDKCGDRVEDDKWYVVRVDMCDTLFMGCDDILTAHVCVLCGNALMGQIRKSKE